MTVVTIAREYGAGGSAVARLVADELGAKVLDRSLIVEVARRASLSPDDVAADDEQGLAFLDRFARALIPLGSAVSGWAAAPESLVDHHAQIVAFTQAVIARAGRLPNVVIVGRGAAVLLRDHPAACNVYLWAPEADRARVIAERLACTEDEARRRLRAVDGRRAAYVREVYGVNWSDRSLYDLILNTGRLGHAGAAAAILGAIGRSSGPGSLRKGRGAHGPLAAVDSSASGRQAEPPKVAPQ